MLLHPHTPKQDRSLSLSLSRSLTLFLSFFGRRLLRRASPVLFRDFTIQKVWLRTRSSLLLSLSLSLSLSFSLTRNARRAPGRPPQNLSVSVGKSSKRGNRPRLTVFFLSLSLSPSLSLSLCSLWLRIRPTCVKNSYYITVHGNLYKAISSPIQHHSRLWYTAGYHNNQQYV